MTDPTRSVSPSLLPWLDDEWQGPKVEYRPPDPDSSWPAEAAYRVLYTRETVVAAEVVLARLPYVEHFGADGWPLTTPLALKPKLSQAFRRLLHTYPLTHPEEGASDEIWLLMNRDLEDPTYELRELALACNLDPEQVIDIRRRRLLKDALQVIEDLFDEVSADGEEEDTAKS